MTFIQTVPEFWCVTDKYSLIEHVFKHENGKNIGTFTSAHFIALFLKKKKCFYLTVLSQSCTPIKSPVG